MVKFKCNYVSKYLFFVFHHQIVRFLVSGGSAAFVQVVGLYFFHSVFGLEYLGASGIAFICAVSVNFVFQKLWTFDDDTRQDVYRQGIFFLLINCVNLILNTAIIYILVNMCDVFYIFAQIITSIIIAVFSFFSYRMIFNSIHSTINLG